MKISYAVSAYFGNRNVTHPNCKNDYTWYIQKHIEYINKQTIKIHKIYIICTFSFEVNKQEILEKLRNIINDDRVIIVERENTGASYASWQKSLHIDNGESDYVILIEDDYILYDEDAVKLMLEYFTESEIFYLCQLWNTKPYRSLEEIIPEHAAMSCGMINNKIYHKFRVDNGVDFKLRYGTGYDIYCANQAEFLENYRRIGLKMIDWTQKYSTYFPHSDVEYGNPNGKKLVVSIDRDLGYF